MPALSARHIASSALCAALLVGITGPAAMAADPARERSHAVPADARLPRAEALLAKLRDVNGGELAPVADLLHAALEADGGRLSAAEARKLGAAAKRALAKVSVEAPSTTTTTTTTTTWDPAADMLSADFGQSAGLADDDDLDDLFDDLLDGVLEDLLEDVGEAVDRLVEAITVSARDVQPEVDDLLTVLEDLVDSLLDESLSESVSSDVKVSSTQTQTSTVKSSDSALNLPVLAPLTQVLLSIL
ncbi:hypothetical protein [Streptomyces spongiae]|uniref:Secreted protein n=1 Tax=Streptomyces spongiae TaxID=565072 RepID=A0A5N8XVI8_9ACTN|nr:hypothetical protein [Streptomyces spongiae]MPY63391.1 hypothetical protein [Streptomyces spongiae]